MFSWLFFCGYKRARMMFSTRAASQTPQAQAQLLLRLLLLLVVEESSRGTYRLLRCGNHLEVCTPFSACGSNTTTHEYVRSHCSAITATAMAAVHGYLRICAPKAPEV
jgi:hypothetical protein